ncbi:adrenodoxin, mitochondrial [Pteropus alecto]|uniref:adrenodoxin, mitochondrial n=1 Tax=Pteropus alecto TaxID=9402 RepID=UPI000D53B866|nr:adrenodoxin, mitochondrial [Pteropus alecto]
MARNGGILPEASEDLRLSANSHMNEPLWKQINLAAAVKPSNDCSPCQHTECHHLRNSEPEPPGQAAPESLTDRNSTLKSFPDKAYIWAHEKSVSTDCFLLPGHGEGAWSRQCAHGAELLGSQPGRTLAVTRGRRAPAPLPARARVASRGRSRAACVASGCYPRGGSAEPGRTLSLSARARSSSEDKVTVHFLNRDGETLTAEGKVGDSLLDVVVENNLDIDGFGACEGTLACSTCHLIFEKHMYEKLEAITDEENDMLDLAYGLTDRSRLGCQICLTKFMDNMTVQVPDAMADVRQSIDVGKNS